MKESPVLELVSAVIIIGLLFDRWRRPRLLPARPISGSLRQTTVKPWTVAGVYATLHTDKGDFTTTEVETVSVDCELITFGLHSPVVPYSCLLSRTTFHLGVTNVETRVDPPVRLYRGTGVTVFQSVAMTSMEATGDARPEWAREIE